MKAGAILIASFLMMAPPASSGQQNFPELRRSDVTSLDRSNLASRATAILRQLPDPKTNYSRLESVLSESEQEHENWKMDFEKRIYEWQFTTSKVVFWVVIVMVLAGLWFSWMHFQASLHPRRKPRQKPLLPTDAAPSTAATVPPLTAPNPELTQFEAYGLKISTPVFGVVILAVSFAFFYLYLQSVYPIK
jgi:hypothetical protein